MHISPCFYNYQLRQYWPPDGEGAAGGLILLRAWLIDVSDVYHEQGRDAALSYVRESISTKFADIRDRFTRGQSRPAEGGDGS